MTNKLEATLPIPHGVVFIYDPTALVTVPPDTSKGPVLATDDCLSLWTVHEIDGSTTLVLTDSHESGSDEVVFKGSLRAPGRRLAFNTSSCEPIIEAELDGDTVQVVVYANDANEPSKLVCLLDMRR